MKILFAFLFTILFGCQNPNTSNQKDGAKNEDLKLEANPSKTEKTLLDSLYDEVIKLESRDIKELQSSYSHYKGQGEILAQYSVSVNSQKLTYEIILKDSAHIYDSLLFEPSEEYKYLSSKIIFNNKVIDISNLKYINGDEVIGPINIWYGKSFGIVGKYYDLPETDVFLIRGLNMYCNGSNCTNFKVLVVQISKISNQLSVTALNYPGNAPFTFEEIHLFLLHNETNPKLYSIKSYKTGANFSDYEVVSLNK